MAESPLLEAPRVRFNPGFAGRLERLVARLGAARERGEARGPARLDALGDEFAGFRPYRAGEDVRHLDWALLARLEQPFVRVHTRAAGERWQIALDASASMGLGAPGKLSFAAELATALAALGQRCGARVALHVARSSGGPLRLEFARRKDLPLWMGALQQIESVPLTPGPEAVLNALAASRERAARVFVLSDLQGLDPARVLALGRPGRRLHVAQVLAPHEREAPPLASARFVDRERPGHVDVELDAATRARYAALLEAQGALWRRCAARAALDFSTWSSSAAFEDAARALLAG